MRAEVEPCGYCAGCRIRLDQAERNVARHGTEDYPGGPVSWAGAEPYPSGTQEHTEPALDDPWADAPEEYFTDDTRILLADEEY